MSDQSRILLAIGGLVLGLALSAGGTYLLGNARAVARYSGTERRRRADLGQYVAAFGALAGFVLSAAGAAAIVFELMPASEAVRLVGAAVTGVLVFATAGVSFSRLADAAETARVQRMPAPSYVPTPATPSPTLPAGLTVPSAPPTEPMTAVAEPMTAAAGPVPALPSSRPAGSGDPPAALDPASGAAGRPLPSADLSGSGIERALAADSGDQDDRSAPIELEHVAGADELISGVRPGWIYRDEKDAWYLGVGNGGSSGPLLRLPEFERVRADEPVYPLLIVGAGEIAVVPVPTPSAADTRPRQPS